MTQLISVGSVAILLLLCIATYRFVIYPALLSPLSKIPAVHPTSHFSSLWMEWMRYKQVENRTIYAAHRRYGPVVRLGPADVSVNCVKGGLQTVYGGGYDKPNWFSLMFDAFGVANMFTTMESKPHSIRKRMISNIYSKSTLNTSSSLRAVSQTIIYDRLLPVLLSAAESSSPINVYSLFGGASMDFVTGYIFGIGISSNFTQNEKQRKRYEEVYYGRRASAFWTVRPALSSTLQRLGIKLIPDGLPAATAEVENFSMQMCDKASDLLANKSSEQFKSEEAFKDAPAHYPTVYALLSSAMHRNAIATGRPDSLTRVEIASELMDHTIAGFETSAISLTYIIWELSRHPDIQTALRAELRRLDPPLKLSSAPHPPEFKEIDALPLLHAVIHETLRLYPGVPGSQPRVTPYKSGGVTLGPPGSPNEYAGIPGGVRISAMAYALHRNEDVFPDPERWAPERWLDRKGRVLNVGTGKAEKAAVSEEVEKDEAERAREMGRWFWVFGSGGRMCIGNNLALYEMKMVVAAIYTQFETKIVGHDDMEQDDGFLGHPKSHRLVIGFKEV